MKKVLLFVGGVVVGYFGLASLMVYNSMSEYAETLFEDENKSIKAAGVPVWKRQAAVVYYK